RFDGCGADVVGVRHGPDPPAPVEGNVEFARQVVEGAVVNDQLGQLLTQRQHIDQFVWVEAGGGIGGEIPNIVGSSAPRVKADRLDATQYLRRVFWLDQANLQICAGGDLHITRGQLF